MNIDELFPVARDLVIKWPDGTPTDVVFKVVSVDSPQYNAVTAKQAQQELDRDEPFSVIELQQRASERVASVIAGWSGLSQGDEPVPYSHPKATELMNKPELKWIREQVEGYVLKRTNFFSRGPEAA